MLVINSEPSLFMISAPEKDAAKINIAVGMISSSTKERMKVATNNGEVDLVGRLIIRETKD